MAHTKINKFYLHVIPLSHHLLVAWIFLEFCSGQTCSHCSTYSRSIQRRKMLHRSQDLAPGMHRSSWRVRKNEFVLVLPRLIADWWLRIKLGTLLTTKKKVVFRDKRQSVVLSLTPHWEHSVSGWGLHAFLEFHLAQGRGGQPGWVGCPPIPGLPQWCRLCHIYDQYVPAPTPVSFLLRWIDE